MIAEPRNRGTDWSKGGRSETPCPTRPRYELRNKRELTVNIFGQIEKLINEHGSAEILNQRLGLAKDQYEALERKNAELAQENEKLKKQATELKQENDRLKQASADPDDKTSEFTDDTRRMLAAFFNCDDISLENIASMIGMKMPMARYHLGLLESARMVRPTGVESFSSPMLFAIQQEGRKYVVKNRINEQEA